MLRDIAFSHNKYCYNTNKAIHFYEYPTGNRLVLEVIILKMMSGKYYMYIKDLTLAGTLEQGQMSSADKVSEGR